MKRFRLPLLALLLFAVAACGGREAERPGLSAVASLSDGSVTGFARALEPRAFAFPADHGAHDDFRTEWWYLTGNLAGPDGARFGYQLTLFRNALAPAGPSRPSPWATRQAWLGHFAITDAAAGSFTSAERWARGAVGLAGARVEPAVRIWVEDWEIAGEPGRGLETFTVRAEDGGRTIDLRLQPLGPAVLHGEGGLSRKGRGEGEASYYYSYPRIETTGALVRDGERIPVTGLSWMDREWSTSVLAPDQSGWDWFALQLEDGRDLMWFQLRDEEGGIDFAGGTLVAAEGSSRRLAAEDVEVVVEDRWTSPRTGTVYPARWRVEAPREDISLRVRPLLLDQELDTAFRYWEGAVEARGRTGDLAGRGYVELVGY